MEAFFASVEQLDNPNFRGKPVMAGGSNERSVIAAATYDTGKFLIRSAMPSVTAKKLLPILRNPTVFFLYLLKKLRGIINQGFHGVGRRNH